MATTLKLKNILPTQEGAAVPRGYLPVRTRAGT